MERRTRRSWLFDHQLYRSQKPIKRPSLQAHLCTHQPDKDLTASVIPDDLRDVPSLVKTACNDFSCPCQLYERLFQEFPSADSCHGAFQARVLLWGPQGYRKREICTNFANLLSAAQKRSILWIEGYSAITFIRDLRFAYHLITGEAHPPGVSVTWQLHRISQVLSQRAKDWFMVVFDLDPDLQRAALNETGIDLTNFLPQGQILMTYSPNLLITNRSTHIFEHLPFEIESNKIDQDIPITLYDQRSTTSSCREDLSPTRETVRDRPEDTPCLSARNPLTSTIGCATAKLGRLSLDIYDQIFKRQRRQASRKRMAAGSPASILLDFSCTMELFLEQLRNNYQDAIHLLLSLVTASARDVPIRLLKNLAIWQHKEAELEDSLEYLKTLSILEIRTLPNGERFVDMHRMVHAWLKSKYHFRRADGYEDARLLTRQWTRVLDQDLPEMQHESHHHKYWIMLHLTLSVLKNAEAMGWHATPLVSLLRKVATFMSEYSVTPLEASRLLARGLYLTSNLVIRESGFDVELERLKLHRERSKICAIIGEYTQARQELNYAQSCLRALDNADDVQNALPFDLNDDFIELMLRQGNHQSARYLIDLTFSQNPQLPVDRAAKLHYWAVCCANDDRIATLVEALQHSHLAMSYWHSLPEEERWNGKCFHMVTWIDAHADLLLQMDRSRGALIFMPKLLEHYIKHCPPTHESIWRVAYCLVREYITILELETAETIACRVLSLYNFDDLEGVSLAWALSMLHVLGATLGRTARYVEAEAVFRKCLVAIEHRHPPRVTGQGEFSTQNLWLEYCFALLVQGKVREAKTARNLAIRRGVDNLGDENWRELAMEPHKGLIKTYNRILRAAQDRLAGDHNLDDNLLDVAWPKTFSIAIEVLGNPFERVEQGMLAAEVDVVPTKKALGWGSLILELLDQRSCIDSIVIPGVGSREQYYDWQSVFGDHISAKGADQQLGLGHYWQTCLCRRRRHRSSSIDLRRILHGQRVRREPSGSHRDTYQIVKSQQQQTISRYFPRKTKYTNRVCGVSCPCVKANSDGEVLTKHIEFKQLYIYRSPNPDEREAREKAYCNALRRFQYRFGIRPAIPYGMTFLNRWRTPEGPTEQNGGAKRQHEVFWAPDFVLVGDAEANWGFLGQDENYIFNNTAMRLRCHGPRNGLPDLPNIIITSYRLGEEVRANCDRYTVRSKKKSYQTNIKDYLDCADEPEASGVEKNLNPVPNRPPRRKGRGAQYNSLRRRPSRSGSSIFSTSSSPLLSPSPSPSSSRSNSRERNGNGMRTQTFENLRLFKINSLHSTGPIFGSENYSTNHATSGTQESSRTRTDQSRPVAEGGHTEDFNVDTNQDIKDDNARFRPVLGLDLSDGHKETDSYSDNAPGFISTFNDEHDERQDHNGDWSEEEEDDEDRRLISDQPHNLSPIEEDENEEEDKDEDQIQAKDQDPHDDRNERGRGARKDRKIPSRRR